MLLPINVPCKGFHGLASCLVNMRIEYNHHANSDNI
jgi:hypothetical protein